MARTVGIAIPARIKAGMIVHSDLELVVAVDLAGLGPARPVSEDERRKATMAPSTRTNTTVATQKTGQKRLSIRRANGPLGSRELSGESGIPITEQLAKTRAMGASAKIRPSFHRCIGGHHRLESP